MQPTIRLTPDEIHTGLWYEKEIAAAQAALNALTLAQNIYVNHLVRVHGEPGKQYRITDWMQGIEEATNG